MITTAQIQLAMMALTRLPAGRIKGAVPSMAKAAWAFPLVGAMIGLIGALALWIGSSVGLSPLISAGLALAVMAGVTGGLHEDGLADFADSFGTADRARKLEIMRDSRIGSYGVIALILMIGLRWASLAELPATAVILPAVLSRAVVPFALHLMPPARADGLGRAAAGKVPLPHLILVCAIAGLAAVLFGSAGIAALLTVALVALGVARIATRMLGGQTGDVLGTMVICSETAALIVLSSCL